MKRILLFALALVSLVTYAQNDVIITTDSKTMEVKIKEVSNTEVRYTELDMPDGPVFVIPVSEVNQITFSNGQVKTYKHEAKSVAQTQPQAQSQSQSQAKTTTAQKPTIKFQSFVEVSGMVGNSQYLGSSNTIGGPTLDVVLGVRVSRFYVGAGVGGYAYIGKFNEGYRYAVNLPIYGNFRAYTSTSERMSSFVDVAVGGAVGLWQSDAVKKDKDNIRSLEPHHDKPESPFFLRSGLGLEFGHAVIGAGYQLMAEGGRYHNFGYIKIGTRF